MCFGNKHIRHYHATMLNYWYSLLLLTYRDLWGPDTSTFGIMSTHVRHLTYLIVSEVTVTKSNEYQ